MKANDIKNVQYKILEFQLENLFNVYEDSESQKYFYNILKTVNIPKDLNPEVFDFYPVKFGDMWTSIAYKFYGEVSLWWVVCTANQILNPTQQPEVGTIIKIIKSSYIAEILNQLK
jgi:hypothetical protein